MWVFCFWILMARACRLRFQFSSSTHAHFLLPLTRSREQKRNNSERSKQVNESRLRVLRAREEALAAALAAAKAAAAAHATADAAKYKSLLVDLALQAVHKLGEPEAVLVGRKCDAALLPEVAAAVSEKFEATFGKKAPKVSASTSTSESDFLPPPPSEAGEGVPSW